MTKQQVPVDSKRKDWPRLAAQAINASQPRTSKLDSFSANATNGLLAQTDEGTVTGRTLTAATSGKLSVTDGDGVAGNPTIDVARFGYSTGDGGTVTQNTSKTTAVTLDKYCGQITMNAASLAAGALASFTLNNSLIETGDNMLVTHNSGGTIAAYNLNARMGSGQATIDVRNLTAGALAEAVVLRFTLIKAANS